MDDGISLEIDITVYPIGEPFTTEGFEKGVHVCAALTELIVARVSERENGELQVGQRARREGAEMFDEVHSIIRRLAFALGADIHEPYRFIRNVADIVVGEIDSDGWMTGFGQFPSGVFSAIARVAGHGSVKDGDFFTHGFSMEAG